MPGIGASAGAGDVGRCEGRRVGCSENQCSAMVSKEQGWLPASLLLESLMRRRAARIVPASIARREAYFHE